MYVPDFMSLQQNYLQCINYFLISGNCFILICANTVISSLSKTVIGKRLKHFFFLFFNLTPYFFFLILICEICVLFKI